MYLTINGINQTFKAFYFPFINNLLEWVDLADTPFKKMYSVYPKCPLK